MLTAKKNKNKRSDEFSLLTLQSWFVDASVTTVRERGELATTKHDHTGTNVTYESD